MKPYKPIAKAIKSGNDDSILASFFRTILFDIGIETGKFNILLEKYIKRAHLPNSTAGSSSTRNNLKKELLKPTMSWKVFIKGLVFLNIKKFELTIVLHHSNHHRTTHTKVVSLVKEKENENE